ncbi:hypothetical protein AAHE18_16G072300 [Arachis hypogaea]
MAERRLNNGGTVAERRRNRGSNTRRRGLSRGLSSSNKGRARVGQKGQNKGWPKNRGRSLNKNEAAARRTRATLSRSCSNADGGGGWTLKNGDEMEGCFGASSKLRSSSLLCRKLEVETGDVRTDY